MRLAARLNIALTKILTRQSHSRKPRACGLPSFLPVRRIAAAVETGDDGQSRVVINNEHHRIGEAPQQGTTNILVDDRKLPRIGTHALNHGVNRRAKKSAQTWSLVLVPILRFDQLATGRPGEYNGMRYGQRCSSSAFRAAHVMPSRRS